MLVILALLPTLGLFSISHAKTCSDLKAQYKGEECCGNPTKEIHDFTAEREEWISTVTSIGDAIRKIAVNKDGTIGISPENAWTLQGNCMHISDYKLASQSDSSQCYNQYFNTFVGEGSTPYNPQHEVREALATFANINKTKIDNLLILSGLHDTEGGPSPELVESSRAKWCGIPPVADEDSNGHPVKQFWQQCVQPHTGYFNVLECDMGGKATAVIGITAQNKGVCFPAHHHFAVETYWQIGGRSTWRHWSDDCTTEEVKPGDDRVAGDLLGAHLQMDPHKSCQLNVTSSDDSVHAVEGNPYLWRDDNGDYKPRLQPYHHYPKTVQELDTTQETGSGEFVLMAYFWAFSWNPMVYTNGNSYRSAIGKWANSSALKSGSGSCADRSDRIPTPEEAAAGAQVTCPPDL